jgi:hypothetical protein
MRARWFLAAPTALILGCGLADEGTGPAGADATVVADHVSLEATGDQGSSPRETSVADGGDPDAVGVADAVDERALTDATDDAPGLPDAADAAGPVDAGTDASGPVDAGPMDTSGPVDATPPDALGPVDGNAPDAPGPVDATPDSARPDTATPTGYAIQLDGNTTYIDCGAVPIPGQFTAEAWVNPTSYSGEAYILAEDRDGDGNGQFRFGFLASGQLFFMMTDGTGNSFGLYSSNAYQLLSPSPVPLHTWSEVAVVKNNTKFSLLVNGASVASFTATGSFVFNDGGQQHAFRIGARVGLNGTSPEGFFSGIVDEVRFWNAPRTSSQIAADMGHRLDSTDPSWANLVDYWPFGEGTGSATADVTGMHPGTLTNGPQWVTNTPF